MPIEKARFPEQQPSFDAAPRFEAWKAAGVQGLVTGRVTRDPSGRLKTEFRLWDVYAGQQVAGQQYFTDPNNWRRIGHIISDAVYTKITGVGAFFDTRVVFVDESGPKENRRKRLAIMDQDGGNVRYLTQGRQPRRDAALLAGDAGYRLHVAGLGAAAAGAGDQSRNRLAPGRRQLPRHDVLARASRPTGSASS